MNQPLVSVLVPVCNTEKFLRDCLDTLVSQTLEQIEIICIDDGSTDSSPLIIQEFVRKDPRVSVITKPNSGYGDSMNQGLKKASGEYIGIVESDDFVEKEMFKDLYDLGKSCDADVVKGNFMYHTSLTDPKFDPVVNNLVGCVFDQPIDPLKNQGVFLTQPAIWSGIYKKTFLEANEIWFLPTPGASFQDTGFNFKVFAAADTAILTQKAYLHYRIDNSASSVKSQKKIFCVCDEYNEIWRFVELDERRFEALKYRIPQIQFGGYQWNLDRLIESLRYDFYKRFVEDFQKTDSRGLINKDYFDEMAWTKLSGMLSDPVGYFYSIYGPIKVERTYIARFESTDFEAVQKSLDEVLSFIGKDDEVIFYSTGSSDQFDQMANSYASQYGQLFYRSNLFTSEAFELIDDSRLRGDFTVIVAPHLDRSFSDLMQNANNSYDVKIYNTSDLVQLKVPLFTSLLFSDFYSDKVKSIVAIDDYPCKKFAYINKESRISLEEYLDVKEAFLILARRSQELFSQISISYAQSVLSLFRPLWEMLKNSYYWLTYDERLRSGDRPSASWFPTVNYYEEEAHETPIEISVIIPVYNVEGYLGTCLDSVLAQDSKLEVICVDDGSTDLSMEILRKYAARDKRLKVVSQLNGGAGAARNRGIEIAHGKYFAFIDPDDFYPAGDTLQKLINEAESNSALVCGGTLDLVDIDGIPDHALLESNSFYIFKERGFKNFSIYANDYGWIRFIYNRSLFNNKKIRFPELYRYEDPVFLLKVADEAKVFYQIPDITYCYRVEYKETSWDAPKVRDLLQGIRENMDFTHSNGWFGLYSQIVRRLDRDYFNPIENNMDDEEVVARMTEIQSNLDFKNIDFISERGWTFFLLHVFDPKPDLALTRLSKRIEKTRFYSTLQGIRKALKDRKK